MARTIAKDHDEKRIAIRIAAARIFATQGVDRASMNAIAKACGISKALIYHYYAGKAELLFDILACHLEGLNEVVDAVPQSAARDYLSAVITEILLAYAGADDLHRILINSRDVLSHDQQAEINATQRQLIAKVSGAVKAASPSIADENLHAVTMSLFGMTNWYFMWNRHEDEAARRDYAAVVAKLFLDGVGAV
ncbi:MAG TPA: TetR/AcrR family transcriptional regulator [Rhodobacteraceae bacterium]|nr:TetR/AcrR family transcriptional regulator [Paracoccaceae bacterium]